MSPKPVIEEFLTRVLGPKSWGMEVLIAHTPQYLGKVLFMNKDHGGPLQYHERKDETFYLLSGEALITYHDAKGDRQTRKMHPGMSMHVPPGAVHQVTALEDCVIFEASTPVFEDRVAV